MALLGASGLEQRNQRRADQAAGQTASVRRRDAGDGAAAGCSAWQTPTISLPKGGGTIRGMGEEFAAVEAAFTTGWNNGQTEGHINRLKLVKRAIFGRAGFPLLRRRVLRTA